MYINPFHTDCNPSFHPHLKKVTGCKLFNHEAINMESAADISMEHFLHRPI